MNRKRKRFFAESHKLLKSGFEQVEQLLDQVEIKPIARDASINDIEILDDNQNSFPNCMLQDDKFGLVNMYTDIHNNDHHSASSALVEVPQLEQQNVEGNTIKGATLSCAANKSEEDSIRTATNTHLTSTSSKIVALVYCQGSITSSKFQIWKTNAKKRYLKSEIELVDNPADPRITIVVLDVAISLSKMLTWAKWSKMPSGVIAVRSEWILLCMKTKKILDTLQYLHNEDLSAKDVSKTPDENAEISRIDAGILSSSRCTDRVEIESRSNTVTTFEPKTPIKGVATAWSMRPENKAKLACQFTGTPHANNLNAHLTNPLEAIVALYTTTKSKRNANEFKLKIYNKAIGILKSLAYQVSDASQLSLIVNAKGKSALGKSVMETCAQVLATGESAKLQGIESHPSNMARSRLIKIWGVGPVTADAMLRAGITNIEVARAKLDDYPFTFQQKVGIKHYEDFQVKIPREEVSRIEAYVKACVQELVVGAQVVAVGSYRRGKSSSGDVDILITPPVGQEEVDVMDALLAKLHRTGFLTDDLAGHEMSSSATRRSYMGVCRELGRPDAIYRRIDIKVYPNSQAAFALLYFTGSDYFNRSMRWYCHSFCHNGHTQHTLSDEGLMPCKRDRKGNVTYKGRSYVCHTERDIFDLLGLVYKEPHERSVYNADITNFHVEQAPPSSPPLQESEDEVA